MEIRLPHLAEGVDGGTVAKILVAEGEQVNKDQPILELETEKAVGTIPSPKSGTVSKIYVKEGQQIAVGQPIMALLGNGAATAQQAGVAPAQAARTEEPQEGPAAAHQARQPRHETLPPASAQPHVGVYQYESKTGAPPPASPSVRKVARDLGIDLTRVKGSEDGGRVTLADLRTYVEQLQRAVFEAKPVATPQAHAAPAAERIDFAKWGPVTRQPLSSIRRTIAQRMTESWTTIPHVTQFDEADVTELMELHKRHSAAYEAKGARLTLTAFIIKAVLVMLKKHPLFNSSLDEVSGELVSKQYYHIGIAVDTEAGLMVPVIKNADQKNLLELSLELRRVADKAKQRSVSIEDLRGGSFTISNQGGIWGAYFTPIINKPEVAILGVGRSVPKPVVKNGKVTTAVLAPLALSYDHRVIDGANAARAMQELVQALQQIREADVKV